MKKISWCLCVALNCMAISAIATPDNQSSIQIHSTKTFQVAVRGSNILDLSELVKTGKKIGIRHPVSGVVTHTGDGKFLKRNGFYYQNDSRLLGFSIPTGLTEDNCTLMDVKASGEEMEAKATGVIKMNVNLSSTSAAPTDPFDEKNPKSYNWRTAANIFDDNGVVHTMSEFYVKSKNNEWIVHIKVDGLYLTRGFMKFSASGDLTSVNDLDDVIFTPAGRSEEQHVKFDFTGTTQYNSSHTSRDMKFDGYPRGDFVEEQVDPNGYISADYTNGQTVTFSKIAVYL